MNTEPIVIPIHGDPSDFVADTNRVNSSLSNVQDSTKKTSMSITDMRSAFQLAGDATRIAGDIWKNTAGEAVKYAEEVKNLSRSLGISAEETSALIQVADDVRISYDSLKIAMKEAQKDGITPNTEGLAKLSDQYLALQPGVERTKFLLDTFGKSGMEMGKLMEKGGDGIREMSDAIDENLILTEDAIKASDEYQKSLDDMNDSALALKVSLGNDLLPVANNFLKVIKAQIDEGFEWQDAIAPLAFIENIQKLKDAQFESSLASMDMSEGMKELSAASEETAPALDEVAVSTEDLTRANQDYLNTIGDATKRIDDYKEKEADLKKTHAELIEEKAKLEGAWWRDEEAIQAVNDKLAENEQAQAENAEAFDMATKSRMLSMLEQQLAVDGLDQKETDFLLQQGLKWGVYSQEAIDAMAAVQRQVDAMERNIDININVRTNYSQAGQAALTNQLAGEKGYVPNQHAGGGSFMVPQMYGNEGFRMGNRDTASAGELITITPAGGRGTDREIVELLRMLVAKPVVTEYTLSQAMRDVVVQVSK